MGQSDSPHHTSPPRLHDSKITDNTRSSSGPSADSKRSGALSEESVFREWSSLKSSFLPLQQVPADISPEKRKLLEEFLGAPLEKCVDSSKEEKVSVEEAKDMAQGEELSVSDEEDLQEEEDLEGLELDDYDEDDSELEEEYEKMLELQSKRPRT